MLIHKTGGSMPPCYIPNNPLMKNVNSETILANRHYTRMIIYGEFYIWKYSIYKIEYQEQI